MAGGSGTGTGTGTSTGPGPGGSSLLARTAAAAAAAAAVASTPNPPPPAHSDHTHTKAYLDALFPASRRLAPSTSTNYKPQKPSSLASSASATGSQEDSDGDGDGDGDNTTGVTVTTVTSPSSSTDDTPLPPATPITPSDPTHAVTAILDDDALDEEDRIDHVRTRLGQLLEDHEGAKPSPFRLDSIVLDVMHRHREDRSPTGAVFPSSPIRRPGSVRSFSSTAASHRPWTPTKPAAAAALTPTDAAITGSAHLGGVQLPRSASPGPASAASAGPIGSGSPRAWANADSLASAPPSTAASNPWSSMLTGPPTPSSSSSSSFSYSFNPFGPAATTAAATTQAAPPGLAPSSAASIAASSRPTSPSPLQSPRMNVAAVAFKPRTASVSSQASSTAASGSAPASASASAIRPWTMGAGSGSRRPSIQSVVPKGLAATATSGGGNDDGDDDGDDDDDDDESHDDGNEDDDEDEDEDDEFSPFATTTSMKKAAARSTTDDPPSAAMSAFDVLSSVLTAPQADHQSTADAQDPNNTWTPEQIEEALATHGYDVDATLAAIFDSGGKPAQWQQRHQQQRAQRSPEVAAATAAPRPTGMRPGAAGVSLMPREALASFRGGKGFAQVQAPSSNAAYALSSSPSYSGSGMSTPPLRSGGSLHGSQSPIPGFGGGAGPGRVCRYFLSGDCRRADCRFSHDLSKALCKFWLRGMCLNDPCPFLHDEELVKGLVGGVAAASLGGSTPPVFTPGGRHSQDLNRDPFDAVSSPALSHSSVGGAPASGGPLASAPPSSSSASSTRDDFPELPPSGPRAHREKQQQQQQRMAAAALSSAAGAAADNFPPPGTPTGPAASDPNRNRWANALQRNKAASGGPMAAVQAANGDAGSGLISIHARNAPQSRVASTVSSAGAIPAGPRAARGASSARISLRPPTLLPTLSVGKSVSQAYSAYRSRSSPALATLLAQRNQLLSKASEAYRKMDGVGARKFSSEANALNIKIRQEEDGSGESIETAREMLRDRHRELSLRLREAAGADGGGWGSSANASMNEPGARGLRGQVCTANGGLGVCLGVARKDGSGGAPSSYAPLEERTEWFLDCHGLHVHEALEIVEEFLLTLESGYPSHRGLTYLGVGVGGGDGGVKRAPKLASAVKGFLASWGYPHAEYDGVVAVDHLTHAM